MKEHIAKIRAWLRERFPSLQFTQKDIESVLSMAARRVRQNSVVKENLTTDGDMRFLAEEKGVAVRVLYEGDKVIPIAEGFNFDKTSDMQQAMQDYISLLDGQRFTIKEDKTDVFFIKNMRLNMRGLTTQNFCAIVTQNYSRQKPRLLRQ